MSSTAILLAGCLGLSLPAWAIDECGSGSSITCTSASNPYASGITYNPAADLTMVVQGGVIINSGANDGIHIDFTSPANLDLRTYSTPYTTANGILLIDAQSDESAGAAFDLAEAVAISGAYQYNYTLEYIASEYAWYLQSTQEAFSDTGEYPALVTASLLAWHADLPALHNRLQDLRWTPDDASPKIEPAAWTGSAPGFPPPQSSETFTSTPPCATSS